MNNKITFRHWVQLKWYEHKDELFAWEKREPDETSKQYFIRYRWMLKALYKHEMNQR
jgi:hypothetical protein